MHHKPHFNDPEKSTKQKFGEQLKTIVKDVQYVKELENDLELMRNQMNYLETRCEKLKNDYHEAIKTKGEQIEKKLNEKILELNNEVDKK